MRVDAYNKIAQVYQTNKVKSTSKISSTSAKDQFEISQIGKDIQVAKQAVNNTNDIRMDKVSDLKKRMESGTYNISAEEVANKLMDSFFDTSI